MSHVKNEFKVLLIYANSMMDNLIPVSVSSLSASLKNAGADVKLFDTTFYRTAERSGDDLRVENLQIPPFKYPEFGVKYTDTDVYEDLKRLVTSYTPNLIGLSVVEPTYKLGLSLLQSIKDHQIPKIVGGIHAIFSPEEIISEEAVDMVCIGEGEKCLTTLCRRMSAGTDYTDIPGIWVKKDGQFFRNRLDDLLKLDDLPPLDFSIYEKERFYRPMHGKIYKMVPIEFSRGCPFRCSYCADHGLEDLYKEKGAWLRKKSIKTIISEIKKYIKEYNAQYFYFVSETFLAMDEERFNDFVKQYSEIRVPFWFNTRPETITEEKIKKLEGINCNRISIGVEHGNEEFRKKILNRHVTNERIIQACKIVEKSKIQYSVNNIIGFPDETRELIFDTINLNRQINPASAGCYYFTPYRGTKLREYAVSKGYIKKDSIAIDLNFEPTLEMPQLRKEEIMGLMRTFNLYVRMPESEFWRIRIAERFDEKGNAMFEELKKEYYKEYF